MVLVIKCHKYFKEVKELLLKKEAKAIYIYRDLRDVVVSTMNKNKISFWQLMRSGFIHSILQEYTKWNRLRDILVSKYEYMITDLVQETLKIADYMGVDLDESSAAEIAEKYSIAKQLQKIRSFDYSTLGIQAETSKYDPNSLLHENHIFSGKTKQWETALSPFKVGLIEGIAYNWLIKKNYPISQIWIVRKIAAMSYLCLYTFQLLIRYTRKIVN
jgi:hypothetical protein